jgi:hypothetical protein
MTTTPSGPRPGADPTAQANPTTQEIPAISGTGAQPAVSMPPAWPETRADDPAPPTMPATTPEGPHATGPVDFVPGFPGAGTFAPQSEEPENGTVRAGVSRDRAMWAGVGLAGLAVLLLQLGLTNGSPDLWSAATLWSAFATAASLLGLLALTARAVAGDRVPAGPARRLTGAASLALAVFWLLVVLPIVAGDAGFLVTAALLALGTAAWIGFSRKS